MVGRGRKKSEGSNPVSSDIVGIVKPQAKSSEEKMGPDNKVPRWRPVPNRVEEVASKEDLVQKIQVAMLHCTYYMIQGT